MALESGRSPLRLLDEDHPDSWSELDLEILSQWKHLKGVKCPGCGRPISQHLHNSRLGREESIEDYTAYSLDCPAVQAIATGQEMWKVDKKSEIDAYSQGTGPDPHLGIYWLSAGEGERLPQGEKPSS